MESLSNRLLLETFEKAKQLNLDEAFIELIELEIYRRNLKKQLLADWHMRTS
ncbi:MAG: sporulation histidine kinase inhibitor Sda [Bacilli bacterium]|nr:sporulation histidine kinase inhibitor Sda [Bacilli bacterium]